MSERLTIDLYNRQQAWIAITNQLFPFLKAVMQGGHQWVLTVTRRKRTPKQNRRYWSNGVLAQIAAQAVVNGKQYPAEIWHEEFKRKFIGVIELPSGEVVGMSSTELDTAEFSAFSDQVEAFAATDLGVTFYDLAPREYIDQATGEITR